MAPNITLEETTNAKSAWSSLNTEQHENFSKNLRYLFHKKLMYEGYIYNYSFDSLIHRNKNGKDDQEKNITEFVRDLCKSENIPPEQQSKFASLITLTCNNMKPEIAQHHAQSKFHNYEFLCVALIAVALTMIFAPQCALALFLVGLGITSNYLLGLAGIMAVGEKVYTKCNIERNLESLEARFVSTLHAQADIGTADTAKHTTDLVDLLANQKAYNEHGTWYERLIKYCSPSTSSAKEL